MLQIFDSIQVANFLNFFVFICLFIKLQFLFTADEKAFGCFKLFQIKETDDGTAIVRYSL